MPDADRYFYAPEDRRGLADAGVVADPEFDAIVLEVRVTSRQVSDYCPLDEQGVPLLAGLAPSDAGAQAS